MAGNPSTHIVFGASPDSYLIAHGRRFVSENIPDQLLRHVQNEMNISMTLWISMGSAPDTWVTHNVATAKYHFSSTIDPTVRAHLAGTNSKFAADFVTFPSSGDPGHFFVKGKASGQWSAVLPQIYVDQLSAARAEIGASQLDNGLTGVLFGKGNTCIWLLAGGFAIQPDENAEEWTEEHPLIKVLLEHQEGWLIERGSCLSFHDSRHFLLKLKNIQRGNVRLHWSLPDNMTVKLKELQDTFAGDPEERRLLAESDQMWLNVVKGRVNSEIQAISSLAAQRNRLGVYARAALTGETVIERRNI